MQQAKARCGRLRPARLGGAGPAQFVHIEAEQARPADDEGRGHHGSRQAQGRQEGARQPAAHGMAAHHQHAQQGEGAAAELGRRFGVTPRTICRDINALAAMGVPVYAELGRGGGFRLMEGYFLPPVMFSTGEAISLLLGLNALRHLRARPFAPELETAEQKLLAAVPDRLRAVLAQAQRLIGFEAAPEDMFVHPEAGTVADGREAETQESTVVTVFLQAILDRRSVSLAYRSPYSAGSQNVAVHPRGLVWDRDRWYLVGSKAKAKHENRLWRADRVMKIMPGEAMPTPQPGFDVRALLGRQWLSEAMQTWIRESPVTLRVSPAQAERLRPATRRRPAARCG